MNNFGEEMVLVPKSYLEYLYRQWEKAVFGPEEEPDDDAQA
jgi:hypothetical protein